MEIHKGDIWDLKDDHAICIPTNLGWRKSNGTNVMGRGLAKQACLRYSNLPTVIGTQYRRRSRQTNLNENPPVFRSIMPDGVELIFLPTKRLREPAFLSWKQDADVQLIRKSLTTLKEKHIGKTAKPKIAIPLVGAGNGHLSPAIVEAVIQEMLGSEKNVTLVLYVGLRARQRESKKK